jgi:hypothetical protein
MAARWLLRHLCDPRYRDIVEGDVAEVFLLRLAVMGRGRHLARLSRRSQHSPHFVFEIDSESTQATGDRHALRP